MPELVHNNSTLATPETEGIKYAGSKRRLLPHILQLAGKTPARSVLDGFSGTTRVAQAFAQSGYRVVANDVAVWSKVFGTCYLLNRLPPAHYQGLIEHLNALPGREGWFTQHYGGEANSTRQDSGKKPWQRHNTEKLDAIREELEALTLTSGEKAVLLTSLIRALDEVDSTLGHFASYLKEWAPRSYKPLKLKVPRLIAPQEEHAVHQGDVFDLLPEVTADLAYYDPPYGSNNDKMPPSRVRYGAYYHLWTSVCLFDRPTLFGKAGRRTDSSDRVGASVFEDFRRGEMGRFRVVEAIEQLLRRTPSPFIILSYSSGGRATAQELQGVVTSVGEQREVVEIDYKRNVMGGMRWTHEWVREAEEPNREFLFLIEKR